MCSLLGHPGDRGATFIPPQGKNTNLYYDAATGLVQALQTFGPTGSLGYQKRLASFRPAPIACPPGAAPAAGPPPAPPAGGGGPS